MSIPYSHHLKVYVGRQKNGEFRVVCYDEHQSSQRSFPEAESLKSYLAKISEIKDARLEICDCAPGESKDLFKDEDVDRIPAGEFLPIVKGLEKKCQEGKVKIEMI